MSRIKRKDRVKEVREVIKSEYQSDSNILAALRENFDDEFPDLDVSKPLVDGLDLVEDSKEKQRRLEREAEARRKNRVKSTSKPSIESSYSLSDDIDDLMASFGAIPKPTKTAKVKGKSKTKKTSKKSAGSSKKKVKKEK